MFEQLQELNKQANRIETEYWVNHDLFSWQWWFIVIINLLFLVLLILFMDKQRIQIITIAFLFSFILVGIVNELGSFYGWWSYPHQFITALKTMNAVDFLTVPVIITLFYQTFGKWKIYLITTTVFFLILSFVGIPIFVYFDFYKLHTWNYFYSFLTLLLVSILVKLFTDFIITKSKSL
ncbi:hypothetical protein BC6307_18045 [Sutcliffiella cohnii]|uniref:Uncharacterized protein n=1 Tax=Sutcliffiella cohnii TaxID=33932 RepID=A0A223KU53_9BACI|nr:CBO0543 family protein [Sutcliffiella cohnii]AST93022.1 hypothetical protein BC6307_18045 [Sutcliffiella cohnii]